jgi:CheY-like chemotaxis protein
MTQKSILLVEDNADDEALALRALRRTEIDAQVAVAHDGVEALALLHGIGAAPLPAVVLLDLKLPRIDGLEVLERVRAHPRTHGLPVVILTSSREERDLLHAYRLHANSYIRKPVDYATFVDAVRFIGQYWLTLNELPPPPREEGSTVPSDEP